MIKFYSFSPWKHLVLLVLLCSNGLAFAQTNSPASAHIQTEITQARVSGTGMFRWFGLAVYEAQLWVGADGFNPEHATATRFALDLNYARALVGSKIADASIDEIQKLKIGSSQQHGQWLAKMKALFPDVVEGSHITGIFLPKEGARFYLNGKLLGEIKDPAFAQAFFAIWLDKNTSAPELRRKLLSAAAPLAPANPPQ